MSDTDTTAATATAATATSAGAAGVAGVASVTAPAPALADMTRAAVISELRALRANTKLNAPRAELDAALVKARRGEGLKPAANAAAPATAPQWTQSHMVRLIEAVVSLAATVAAICGGRTREDLDNRAPGPWTRVAEVFNHDDITPWEDAPDADLAFAAATTPPATHHRTWSYLKDKWGQLKSSYTIPLARFTSSGQGDPDAAFSDFLHAGDNHHRVLTYLHHRLVSIDTSSMDGMGSRLIRQDALHDNDRYVNLRGNPRAQQRRRTSESGGFLTNASEEEISRIFRPDNTAQRLDVLMSHYGHLADDVQRSIDQLIRNEVESLTALQLQPAATAAASAPDHYLGRRRVARRRALARTCSPSPDFVEEEHLEEEEQLCEEEVEEPATHHRVSTAPYHPPNEDDSDLY